MTDIERALGYTFRDVTLLRRALTLKGVDEHFNNESLECLGDSLIGFVVAEKFFLDGLDEGGITARKKSVVGDRALAEVSRSLGLDSALIRPRDGGGNKKAVPSAYEAVAAAVYLDGGMEAAKNFILRTLDFSRDERDYIALLQEALQAERRPLPVYSHGTDCGTPAAHDFSVTVSVQGAEYVGRGGNTASAKRAAARAAYLDLFSKNT